MKKRGLFVLLFLLSFALGCSQNGDDETKIQLSSTDELDGYIVRYGSGAVTVGVDTGWAIAMGDWVTNDQLRGFVSFDLSIIPIGSTIKSARLRLYQTEYIAGDPYGDLGVIVVDHVVIGGTLDSSDYDGGLIASNVGTLSSNDKEEWKELNVTEAVQRDIDDGRDDAQFRLRFIQETDNNGADDIVRFEDGENNKGTGNQPSLVITYE